MDNDICRWETEGGSLWKLSPSGRYYALRRALESMYPKFDYVDMDASMYWKSLTPLHEGDIIEYQGKEYRVLYGWHWTSYGPIPVYMAEIEPVGVPETESRMRK